MSLKAIDTGFLRNLITYDTIGNISLPAGLSIFVNKEVATKEYVDAQNSGQVLQSRTLTINGVTYDLSANRSWTIDSMVYPSAGIALSSGTGWGTSITNNSANWNTAYGWGNHASAGYVPYTGATANVNLGAYRITTSSPFIDNIGSGGSLNFKMYNASDDHALNNNDYFCFYPLAGYYAIFSFNNAGVRKRFLFHTGNLAPDTPRYYGMPNADGTFALTSDLTVHELLSNKSTNTALGTSNTLYPTQLAVKTYVDNAVTGGINIQGDWNANTNSPNISTNTTTGFTWRVSVAGTTNLGGITVWNVNDLAVKTGGGWIKIDNSSTVQSVFGRQGVVVATTGDYNTAQVTESVGSLYFTTARARASFSAGANVAIDANGVISSTDTNTTYSNFTRTVAGLVPNPGGSSTTRYLREDGTWVIPPDTIVTSLPWTSITSRPTALSQFTNDLGNYGSWITSSGTAAAVSQTVAANVEGNLVYGNMAANDQFRIRIGGASNAGWVELATADDGTEPIYVRQYTGVFTTVARTATLLDGSGNTSFPGSVTANNFIGYLTGNISGSADSATYGRYVYDNGLNGGSVGYKEPAALHVNYATDSRRAQFADIGFYVRNYLANGARNNEMTFYWVGQSGQPTWLWGSNNGTDIYVWNPANFSVNYATTAGSATDSSKLPLAGGTLTGDLGINGGGGNVPLSMNSVEPYMHIVANGASNTAGIRLYPTNGYTALIGNFRASGELVLVASNTEAVFINSNSIRVNKYRFNGNGTLSGNGTPEIVDKESVGMAMQSFSYVWYNSNATVLMMSLNSQGNLTASGFYEWSDIRYKNVIETNPDITGLGIDVIKFTREDSDKIRYGYSAQQVQALIPDAVDGTDKLFVNYMDVHTLKIASLERRVKELENKLKSTL
jgi:hypothetical protein